ncbi:TetR/AcrR family transcriptional regulator [Roseicyclus persicicus]|uniref:TetR/AcrR family transcriptional regulator n=1 Tax=Roseicyclus persicicus TaxID=2650661 RepID=A0A7X6GXH7_9RHOB|nr:TetR/AcrR family transcriptional regulator [Roseibacterium persicicum]NKX44214.1 TetR/AcrR family transcriptional regulator [Roseibacterium persicicum]
MLKEKRKTYHHGDLKPALIAAGLRLLEDRGLEALSLRAIAAEVGVSHTAPKNHFDGLKGLLTAIATEGFRRHAAEMRRGAEAEPPGKARLQAACDGYLRFALAHPELFRLMFSRTLCNHDDPELRRASRASYEVLRGIAHGLDWDKAGAPGAPWRTEWMLWSLVHGYAMLLIEGQIARAPDGGAPFPASGLMPDFGYLAGVDLSAPPAMADPVSDSAARSRGR